MPTPLTISEFWDSARQSRLFSAEQLEAMRAEIQQGRVGSPQMLAQWCQAKGWLTNYQARTLLRGKAAKLVVGRFAITGPADQPQWKGWFWATDRSGGDPVLLKFCRPEKVNEELSNWRQSPLVSRLDCVREGAQSFLVARPEDTKPLPVPAPPRQIDVQDHRSEVVPPLRHARKSKVRSRSRERIWIGCGLIVLAGMAWYGYRLAAPVAKRTTQTGGQDRPLLGKGTDQEKIPPPSAGTYGSPDADGELWARPIDGQPISLSYLPPGTQVIAEARLAALARHPEGPKILQSLGPTFPDALHSWLEHLGLETSQVDRLTLGLIAQTTRLPGMVAVLHLTQDVSRANVSPAHPEGSLETRDDETIRWWPPDGAGRILVVGPAKAIEESRQQGEVEIPLRRELSLLHRATHDSDHFTLLASPHFFRDEAHAMFLGPRQRLLAALQSFWGDQAQAMALGIQLTDTAAYIEFRLVAREDWSPLQLRRHLERQVAELPARITDYLGGVQLDPYWQPLALRYPAMLGYLAEHTKPAVEGRQVVLTAALPVEALHNLFLATELAVSSPSRTTEPNRQADFSRWTMADLLTAKLSVRVAQSSLEFIVRDIAAQVRDEFPRLPFEFQVEIMGRDLEPEGITRNQQIRDFVFSQVPLREILTALVMEANPDPTVGDAKDVNQKLVWVIEPPTGTKILVTTRAAALRRGLDLPTEFRP